MSPLSYYYYYYYSVVSLAMGHWGACYPSSLENSVHSVASASFTVKLFSKITKENMYYIFVYLARNTLKLMNTD